MTEKQEDIIDILLEGDHGVAMALIGITYGHFRPVKGRREWEIYRDGKWVPDNLEEIVDCVRSLSRKTEECIPIVANEPNFDYRSVLLLCRIRKRMNSAGYIRTLIRLAKRTYLFYEREGWLDRLKPYAQIFQEE